MAYASVRRTAHPRAHVSVPNVDIVRPGLAAGVLGEDVRLGDAQGIRVADDLHLDGASCAVGSQLEHVRAVAADHGCLVLVAVTGLGDGQVDPANLWVIVDV